MPPRASPDTMTGDVGLRESNSGLHHRTPIDRDRSCRSGRRGLAAAQPPPEDAGHARTQHVGLTDAQQMQLGAQEYNKTLRTDRARLVSSGRQYTEVQRVARRIESVASRDKPDFVWRVSLIKKNEANTYCLPGGKIVVFTGILPITKNDAGLATVLGHEVAHATAEHVAERIERQHLTEVAATIIAGGGAYTPAQFCGSKPCSASGRACRSAARRSPRRTTSG
jgi:predicted Zn-dependent protease